MGIDQTPLRNDPSPNDRGVLLSDQIAYYARVHKMIHPFSKTALRPAGYCLHVGDEFMIAGQRYVFKDQRLTDLTIQPYEVAIIKIQERVCIPQFLIGRWNIKVSLAYRGLMWVGGAQVDPGFKGNLYCPIYNLSDRPVRLRQGEELAVIDFVKATAFRPKDEYTVEFETEKHAYRDFYDYDADQLESALIKHADDIEDVKTQARSVDTRMTWFTAIVISLLGLFGMSRFVTASAVSSMELPNIALVILGAVSVVLLVIVATQSIGRVTSGSVRDAVRLLSTRPKIFLRLHRWWIYFLSVLLTLVFVALYFLFAEPFDRLRDRTNNIEKRVQELESLTKQLPRKSVATRRAGKEVPGEMGTPTQ